MIHRLQAAAALRPARPSRQLPAPPTPTGAPPAGVPPLASAWDPASEAGSTRGGGLGTSPAPAPADPPPPELASQSAWVILGGAGPLLKGNKQQNKLRKNTNKEVRKITYFFNQCHLRDDMSMGLPPADHGVDSGLERIGVSSASPHAGARARFTPRRHSSSLESNDNGVLGRRPLRRAWSGFALLWLRKMVQRPRLRRELHRLGHVTP